jgi:hypothetical protein
MKIRPTAKNSIVTYNAIQKVYKARFDDLRSHINFDDFTNAFTKYPFLTDRKSSYENIISKNKDFFFNTNYYNTVFKNKYNILKGIINPNNIILFDIPFLLSMKSDAARYM